ncbi:ubiquitin carboxyl-terminal hydrolase 27 isoform X2 [Iris pallida]|uniref:Ubiquitin carboxyl-terminal hydrolase n=1 Tax=Iris pallida TaxID=29817 RepID=A0AAX6GAJ2_IRIPA|nr:ubiquitin carboxyl-terminal hydrolase 27 isoform X2 [Iris pallida]
MRNREVTIYHLIPTLKHSYSVIYKGYIPSQYHSLLAGILGIGVGLTGLKLCESFISEKKKSFHIEHTVSGLRNFGNNCFLNVILQALASSSYFLSFLQNVIASYDIEIEENAENLLLTVALSSLLEELRIIRDEKTVHNPREVMVAMDLYLSSFNLTSQQDAAEAFIHLMSSLEKEISHCYVQYHCSLGDITTLSRIYMPRIALNVYESWKQQVLGPFNGTLGSSLICTSCSSMLSLDFELFRCLLLSPVLEMEAEIMEGCTLVDCFKHFTAVEHVDNYRCSRCWHIAALKYSSEKLDKDEEKIQMLSNCVKPGFCNCKSLFQQEEITSSGSRVAKQLSIAHCPRILCIQLERASMNEYGGLIKLQGHISFPLFLDLLPFITNMGRATLDENVQKHGNQQNPFVPLLQHINTQQEMDISSTFKPPRHPSNKTTNVHSSKDTVDGSEIVSLDETGTNDKATTIGELNSSNMYRLTSVVEHYGIPGSGHYAVYRRLESDLGAGASMGPSEAVNQQWVYVSDDEVSVVSEEAVLSAEASLLFYDRIEGMEAGKYQM